MVTVPTNRQPTHPGEMLLIEFLEPLGLTQSELAKRIGVPFQRVNSLIRGKRSVTPDTAFRLARLFGTSASFWMNHQLRWDLFHAQRDAGDVLKRIDPLQRDDLADAA